MCLGVGGSDDDEFNVIRNREIDRMIRADERKRAKEIKLLLLGWSYLQGRWLAIGVG
jgi:hypothetical protein